MANAITAEVRAAVIASMTELELVQVINKFEVQCFAQKDKSTLAFNGRTTTTFLANDGKRNFMNRVQNMAVLDEEGRSTWGWARGQELRDPNLAPVQVTA